MDQWIPDEEQLTMKQRIFFLLMSDFTQPPCLTLTSIHRFDNPRNALETKLRLEGRERTKIGCRHLSNGQKSG